MNTIGTYCSSGVHLDINFQLRVAFPARPIEYLQLLIQLRLDARTTRFQIELLNCVRNLKPPSAAL